MVIDDGAERPDDPVEDTEVATDPGGSEDTDPERRRFLGNVSRAAMTAGLIGGYGALGLIAGRYLYPARPSERIWQYVTEVDGMAVGATRLFRSPTGESINIVRQGGAGDERDFIALSSSRRCPTRPSCARTAPRVTPARRRARRSGHRTRSAHGVASAMCPR